MTFLGRVDGELDASPATVGAVARVIRTVRPQVVLGHDPWKRYRLHPDHRAAGFLVCDAIVAARDPHFFREHGLAHHRPDALLLWEADAPDHVEDVTASLAAQARRACWPTRASSSRRCTPSTTPTSRRSVSGSVPASPTLGEPHGLAAAEVFKLITDL